MVPARHEPPQKAHLEHHVPGKSAFFGVTTGVPTAHAKPETVYEPRHSHAEQMALLDPPRGVLIDCMRRVREVEDVLASVRGTLAGVCEEPDPGDGLRRSRSRYNAVPDGVAKAVATELRLPPPPLGAKDVQALSDESPGHLRPRASRHGLPQPKYLVDQIVIDSVAAFDSLEGREGQKQRQQGSVSKIFARASTMIASKTTATDASAQTTQGIGMPPPRRDFVVESTGPWGVLKVPVAHPEARLRLFWLMVGFVFIVCEAYLIPYYICFGVSAEGFFLGFVYCANTYFIFDIPATFLCGYLDDSNALITSPSKIAMRYLRSWLIPDLVAGIPWEWIDISEDTASFTKSLRFVRAFRLLRLTRLLRLMKMKSFMENVEIFIESNQGIVFAVGVGRVLALLFAFTHWAACAWYVLGARSSKFGDTWLEWKFGDFPLSLETVHQKYTYALYFSLTTMTTVGYGDITPQNYDEVCFTLVLLGMASIVFAMLMGVLTDLIGNLNNQSHVRAEKKVLLSRYMHWRAVPRSLWMSIRQHLIFLWDTNEDYDAYEDEIKGLLPPVLKTELCYHVYGRILHSAPFLMWMKHTTICIKQLASMAQSLFLSKGDYIFRMGQENEQIYMLLAGMVRLSRNERHDSQDSKTLAGTDGASGFHIPRKKEGNVMDLGMAMASTAKNTLKHKGEEVNKAAHVVKLLSPVKSTTRMSRLEDVKPTVTEASSVESVKRGPNCAVGIFDSEVLRSAESMLNRQDAAEQRAARLMQAAWRRKRELRAKMEAEDSVGKTTTDRFNSVHSVKSVDSAKSKARTRIDQMPSRTVEAPAYFGESCLWVPYEDWDCCAPPKYTYSATCEVRSELVYIPRSAVQDIIVQYSPWLQERFEYFRECVVRGLQSAAPGPSMAMPCSSVDWAAIDAAMTFGEQEGALDAMHREALGRQPAAMPTAPKHPLRANLNDGPAMPRTYRDLGPSGKAVNMSARDWVRQGSRLSSGLVREQW